MKMRNIFKVRLRVLRFYFWMLLVLWTAFVGSVLLWSTYHEKIKTEEIAHIMARSAFQKDLAYRRWATSHGGVYVPVSEKTPPNPFLAYIKERDITTPSGRTLTLVNPAYMTRQVHEIGKEQYGLHGHITSLNPVRPENAADEWETKALMAFEQGTKEVSSIESLDGGSYMRLMRPLVTEENCLTCHAEQGYKVGDLRGGISVSVPMAPLWATAREHLKSLTFGHGVLWLLGVVGICFGGNRLKKRITEREDFERQLESLAKFPSENPNPVLRITKKGQLLYANDAGESFLAEWNCQVGNIVPANWQQIVSEAFESETEKRIEIEHQGRTYSFAIAPVIEADYANLYGRDITERKRAEQQQTHLTEVLDAKNRELVRFSDMIRHEFGNLTLSIHLLSKDLTKVTSQFARTLEGLDIEKKSRDELVAIVEENVLSDINFIENATDQMSAMLKGLRQVAEVGNIEIKIQPVDMNKLIGEITGTMKSQIQTNEIKLVIEQLPASLADVGQVRQVFTNLLTNAIKYMDHERKGRIHISGRVNDGRSIYCIADNGIGISSEHCEMVFDVFYRAVSSKYVSGEGLGLSIVAKSLERQNGTIRLESVLAKGSKFFVSLPTA